VGSAQDSRACLKRQAAGGEVVGQPQDGLDWRLRDGAGYVVDDRPGEVGRLVCAHFHRDCKALSQPAGFVI